MELTAEGIAQAVFDEMANTGCDELDAIDRIHALIIRSPKKCQQVWHNAGPKIIHQWTRDSLRGFLGSGPRPSVPFNYGRNRRKERLAEIGYLGCLYRLPDGTLKPIGDLDAVDLGELIIQYREIAARNEHHAAELAHVRSFMDDGKRVADCVDLLDDRAHGYLKAVARLPE